MKWEIHTTAGVHWCHTLHGVKAKMLEAHAPSDANPLPGFPKIEAVKFIGPFCTLTMPPRALRECVSELQICHAHAVRDYDETARMKGRIYAAR